MKAKHQQELFGLSYLLAITIAVASANDVCRYFPNNTVIRDPDDCSHAIQCVDFKPKSYLQCKGSTPFFDKDSLKCVKDLKDQSSCQINCHELAEKFVSDPKSCRGYYYCFDDEFAMHGQCPEGMHFNQTQQACIYKFSSDCKVELFDFCSVVKNGVMFNDESGCDTYFVCKSGVLKSEKCKKTYYDAVLGECVQKSQTHCPVHPYPDNVCGTSKKPIKNKFVGDEATCRGYYYCSDKPDGPDMNPIWQQCPENTFFDEATQKCSNPLQVKCDASADRCDGRTLEFVVSADKGCREYLRCRDGRTVQELSCGNSFFNEEQQHCTGMIIQYPSCT